MLNIKTQEELVKFLTSYKSATRANFVSKTEFKLNKKDVATKTKPNPFANEKIYKVSVFSGDINFEYEDRVNDSRLLEGKEQNFEVSAAKWGDYVSKSLTKKDDKFYIKVIPVKSLIKPVYEKEDGTQVDFSEIEKFAPVSKSSGNQGLDKEVIFRAYKLDSIIHVAIPDLVEYTQE